MLKSHFEAAENHLLAISKIPESTGHPLHKGTPREAFIKEFLTSHLSESVAIGTGEIIDANSKSGETRNQIDIVIYRRNYPKLDFGGGISGFLAESVVATIEVKSKLDEPALAQGIRTAQSIKQLKSNIVQSFSAGYQPPSILSYLVAYDGPAKMETVHSWIEKVSLSEGITYPMMGITAQERLGIASPSIDAILVLGKGFLYFDNVPAGFVTDELRRQNPEVHWVCANSAYGSLLLLFLFLTQAVSGVSGSWLNPIPYLSNFRVDGIELRT